MTAFKVSGYDRVSKSGLVISAKVRERSRNAVEITERRAASIVSTDDTDVTYDSILIIIIHKKQLKLKFQIQQVKHTLHIIYIWRSFLNQ